MTQEFWAVDSGTCGESLILFSDEKLAIAYAQRVYGYGKARKAELAPAGARLVTLHTVVFDADKGCVSRRNDAPYCVLSDEEARKEERGRAQGTPWFTPSDRFFVGTSLISFEEAERLAREAAATARAGPPASQGQDSDQGSM